MPVKGLQVLPFIAAMLFAGAAFAQDQQRGMLGGAVDLKSAILSPAPFGPPAQFEAPPAAAKEGPAVAVKPPPARAPVVADTPARSKAARDKPQPKAAIAVRKPKPSPLNSYARDARRQNWPCVGGGICAWR